MKRVLAIFLLAATSLFGQSPKREVFPADYKPSPCAPDSATMCASFDRTRLARYATAFRTYDIEGEWLDAHWDEMGTVFAPLCTKMGSCYTVPGNDPIFCVDIMRDDFLNSCDRFPAGSHDFDQCKKFAMTYFLGLGLKTDTFNAAQACGKAAQPANASLRTMEAWIDQEHLPVDFDGDLIVSAYDSETHIPIRAGYTIDAGELISSEGPSATGGYAAEWKSKLKRVPNAEGHRDAVPPAMTLQFPGYQPLTLTLPIATPKMLVELSPAASALKRGKNTLTVTARDSITGKPVEARVMAGDRPLGPTNKPLELELERGEKVPEIWVTSLYDRYSDVVAAKQGRTIK